MQMDLPMAGRFLVVLARVMVDMLAPVGVFQFEDAVPVAGRLKLTEVVYIGGLL